MWGFLVKVHLVNVHLVFVFGICPFGKCPFGKCHLKKYERFCVFGWFLFLSVFLLLFSKGNKIKRLSTLPIFLSVLCCDLVQRKVVQVICAVWQDRDGQPGQVGSIFEQIRVSCTASSFSIFLINYLVLSIDQNLITVLRIILSQPQTLWKKTKSTKHRTLP